mmetsp:Transcript_109717/g.217905  ORF Transcript_109717/g.217905 Transcript_109717/m.217905 type:complete len:225 (-) Transcript_109717:460-1134(-)
MSMRASGCSSSACSRFVFLTRERGCELGDGSPGFGILSIPMSLDWESRSTSLTCLGVGKDPVRLSMVDVGGIAPRGVEPPNADWAKFVHAASSCLTQFSASRRTDVRGWIGNCACSSAATRVPRGLCSGGSEVPAAVLRPANKSGSFVEKRYAVTELGGALVTLWDFAITASQFLPSVTASGWSSPKLFFATLCPSWNAIAALSYSRRKSRSTATLWYAIASTE